MDIGKEHGLNDGQWHTLSVDYRNWTITLSLDNCDIGLNIARPHLFDHPCASQLNLELEYR